MEPVRDTGKVVVIYKLNSYPPSYPYPAENYTPVKSYPFGNTVWIRVEDAHVNDLIIALRDAKAWPNESVINTKFV